MQEEKKFMAEHQKLFRPVCHAIEGTDSTVDRRRSKIRLPLTPKKAVKQSDVKERIPTGNLSGRAKGHSMPLRYDFSAIFTVYCR